MTLFFRIGSGSVLPQNSVFTFRGSLRHAAARLNTVFWFQSDCFRKFSSLSALEQAHQISDKPEKSVTAQLASCTDGNETSEVGILPFFLLFILDRNGVTAAGKLGVNLTVVRLSRVHTKFQFSALPLKMCS